MSDQPRLETAAEPDPESSVIALALIEDNRLLEQQVTHILVVSDSPDLDLAANRRLAAELRRLKAGFAMTGPLAVGDDPAPPESAPVSPEADPSGVEP